MLETEKNKKGTGLKFLAVISFIAIIIGIAWLSVKLVSVAPSAFSSLASLAEVMNRPTETVTPKDQDDDTRLVKFQVTSNKTLLNVGEPVTLSWERARSTGSYVFSYQCASGISIDLQDVMGLKSIDCETNYNIGDTTTVTLLIDSEKERYVDVLYTISFLGTNDQTPRATGSASLTIINSDIQNILGQAETEEETTTTEPTDVPTPDTSETVTRRPTQPTAPAPTTPSYEQQYTYTIPTSDPAGRTDLGTRYITTGTITGNTFLPGTIRRQAEGALQFEVKNYGTKTSERWSYTVSLPDGSTYRSPAQEPLKPNERAVLSIGFPTTSSTQHTFVVTVSEPTDKNRLNDQFSQTVTFTN
jgi:hypothetical protein